MKRTGIEEWRPIGRLIGYEASNLGRIRSICWTLNRFHKTLAAVPRIKAQYVNENGYRIVGIGDTKRRVHVLVAEAFIGPKRKGMDVNHKDGDKANNRPENLEYMTRSENCKHGFRVGLSFTPFREYQGVNHPHAVLNNDSVRAIRKAFRNGTPRRTLATQYGVSYYTVWDITTGRSWTHIAD